MKRILLILIILIILALGFLYSAKNTKKTLPSVPIINTPVPSITNIPSTNCLASDFQATLSLDHGAGNVYGKLILKNVSNKICQVTGNDFISPIYDTNIFKNISIEHQGKPEKNIFALNPSQELYSQIHYPNGPQCNGETMTAKVQFTYAISQDINIAFIDDQGNKDQKVQVCKSPAEDTIIQTWNISSSPITQ